MKKSVRTAALIITALLTTSCVDATIEQFQRNQAIIGSGDHIVVLGRRHNNSYETELNFVDCVSAALARGKTGMNVIPETQFVDELFPWFEPRTAPLHTEDLPELLANPLVAERIERQGLRYLIWLDGSTNTTDRGGSMTCTVSPVGGGCFGLMSWARDSSYEASIWDLRTQESIGRISTDASGTSYMPALIVPVPIIARVQAEACDGMANQLRQFFTGAG